MNIPYFIPVPLSSGMTGWPWDAAVETIPAALPSGRPWPRITLVTPSFNHAAYLEETIRSVLLQGYPNLEYVVMDGGSTDGSVDIIRHYAGLLAHWESGKDGGQSHALNKGFAQGTGDIFGWLNSDDYLCAGALRTLVEFREREPGAVAWVGACRLVDGNDAPLRDVAPSCGGPEAMAAWGERAHFIQPACLFSAEAFRKAGGQVDERLHYTMDVDLWIRLSKLGRFAATPSLVAVGRDYPEAKTRRNAVAREAEFVAVGIMSGNPAIAERRLLQYAEQRMKGAHNRLRAMEERLKAADPAQWSFGRLLRHALKRLLPGG